MLPERARLKEHSSGGLRLLLALACVLLVWALLFPSPPTSSPRTPETQAEFVAKDETKKIIEFSAEKHKPKLKKVEEKKSKECPSNRSSGLTRCLFILHIYHIFLFSITYFHRIQGGRSYRAC